MFNGGGEGWTDGEWKQFDEEQQNVAGRIDRAAGRLRSLAQAMSDGKVEGADRQTQLMAQRVFGDGLAASDLLSTADKFDIASSMLRDQDTYKADALSKDDYLKIPGTDARQGAMVRTSDPTRMILNKGRSDFFGPVLDRIFTHEPFHQKGLELSDSPDGKINAYRNSDRPEEVDAYRRLRQHPYDALTNPDALSAFILGEWK